MEENRKWNASWIWHQGYPWTSETGAHEMVCFRREFDVADPDHARLIVDVTADSRYRLFLNGESVSVGPCKGDRSTHYYETVDLSDRLIAGTNVLAVQVLHYAPSGPHLLGVSGPISVHRAVSGAMLLEGELIENGQSQPLHSDEKWQCKKMPGFKLVPSPIILWLGGCEDTDGRGLDHGWELPGFTADGWANAVIICETGESFGQLTPWQLAPRPIPPMREEHASFKGITKANDRAVQSYYEALLDGRRAETVRIEAGESISGWRLMPES
ncbi:alpha-L-rhamnosidase N-terminal domain-containing protein [Paenibacillus sp. LPE1-1-1.1]|uniref:alpha-L-rhamnosidase N-terminal domain-containing protein n=1 Tax=Paenibacillus sp. LPE1-1-1.1 TaxID=3135230 RepID=UPI00343C1CC9